MCSPVPYLLSLLGQVQPVPLPQLDQPLHVPLSFRTHSFCIRLPLFQTQGTQIRNTADKHPPHLPGLLFDLLFSISTKASTGIVLITVNYIPGMVCAEVIKIRKESW